MGGNFKLSLSADIGVSVASSAVRDDHWLDELSIDFQYFDRFIKYLNLRKTGLIQLLLIRTPNQSFRCWEIQMLIMVIIEEDC
jgi:hypothetical protein